MPKGKKAPAPKAPTPLELWEQSKQITIDLARGDGITGLKQWQIIYKTIDRWALEDQTIAQEKVRDFMKSGKIKKEIRNAARAVKAGTHEQINASSQAEFLIKVALGEQVSLWGKIFEKVARLKDGGEASITKLAELQRIPTEEFQTAPVQVKDLRNTNSKVNGIEKNKSILTGHTGAAYFNTEGTQATKSDQAVSTDGSARAGIHARQLEIQKESSHHSTYSMRLSKAMDQLQEDGTKILRAFRDHGFHKNSNWKGFHIKNAEDALAAAIRANNTYKKRQTKEKAIREDYADVSSASETYTEIRTDSEVYSDKYEEFVEKVTREDPFEEFATDHNINTESHVFKQKLRKLEACLGKDPDQITL